MRSALLAMIGATALGLGACSDPEAQQQALEKEALAALDETTLDPMALQVRRVTLKDDHTICGEVNRKDKAGAYLGFEVFLLDRRSGKASVAVPAPLETTDGVEAINICADAEQKRRFAKKKAQAVATFNRDLDAFARETRIKELEAKLALELAKQ